MKKYSKQVFLLMAMLVMVLAVLVGGCKKDEETTTGPVTPGPVNTGTANFTRYVSLGNSLTAGYQSNALSARDQEWSFPSILARAVQKHVGFEQPLIKNPGIGARKRLVSLTGPVIVDETGVNPLDPASNLNGALTRPYNNLGIPGAILFDMADTTDFGVKSVARQNPMFSQILRSGALGKSIIAQAKALNPTFITLWIGNNDVLGYATSGGTSGTNFTFNGPTDAPVFAALFRNLMDELKTTGAGIVVANIPDVTSIPFFNTVPWNSLVLTSAQAAGLNAATGGVFNFVAGANGFLATTGTGSIKKLTASDFVLLTVPQDSLKKGLGSVIGTSLAPIPSKWVLDAAEVTIAQNAITNFNTIIDSVCQNRGIAVVNANAVLASIKTSGKYISGLGTFSAAYVTGGLFSYDGVHPSSRGAAIMANEFIKVINTKFNGQIPEYPVASAPGQPMGKIVVSENQIPQYGSFDEYIRLITGWR